MAASLPAAKEPVVGEGGGLHRFYRAVLEDWFRRLGGGKNLKWDADATGYTVTYTEADGTVHTKTTTW